MSKKTKLGEAQTLARNLLTDPHYQENLRLRLMTGELPAPLETLLYHYAFGKPVEVIAIDDNREMEKFSDEELAEMERNLRQLTSKPGAQETVDDTPIH